MRGAADIHADWDGVSDIKAEVKFQINAAANSGDTVDIKLIARYMGVGDNAVQTQTVEVATVVGPAAQYEMFQAVFTLDANLSGQEILVGDQLSININLETDTSEIDNITVVSMSFSYLTTHMGIEDGDE